MKILIVHNFYGSDAPSGENNVVFLEKGMLERNGHKVELLAFQSNYLRSLPVLGSVIGGLTNIFNPWALARLFISLKIKKPDIIHVHNTFPIISPSIFLFFGKFFPFVLTLHNYRILCPAAIPLRLGKVCTKCIDSKNPFWAVKYSCYRGSILGSLFVALSNFLHHFFGSWKDNVSSFICLTSFQRQMFLSYGIPKDKMFVKPNFFSGKPLIVPFIRRKNECIYVGRISEEKGLRVLIKAWEKLGSDAPSLKIIGSGPILDSLKRECFDPKVLFLGQLSQEDVYKEISESKLIIIPSIWFEGFPMVIREAMAYGVPIAASNVGSLAEIIKDGKSGILFDPNSASDLAEKIQINFKESHLKNLSQESQNEFVKKYTEVKNYHSLMTIYEKTLYDFKKN